MSSANSSNASSSNSASGSMVLNQTRHEPFYYRIDGLISTHVPGYTNLENKRPYREHLKLFLNLIMPMYEPMYDSNIKINRLNKFLLFLDGLELNGSLEATIALWYQTKIDKIDFDEIRLGTNGLYVEKAQHSLTNSSVLGGQAPHNLLTLDASCILPDTEDNSSIPPPTSKLSTSGNSTRKNNFSGSNFSGNNFSGINFSGNSTRTNISSVNNSTLPPTPILAFPSATKCIQPGKNPRPNVDNTRVVSIGPANIQAFNYKAANQRTAANFSNSSIYQTESSNISSDTPDQEIDIPADGNNFKIPQVSPRRLRSDSLQNLKICDKQRQQINYLKKKCELDSNYQPTNLNDTYVEDPSRSYLSIQYSEGGRGACLNPARNKRHQLRKKAGLDVSQYVISDIAKSRSIQKKVSYLCWFEGYDKYEWVQSKDLVGLTNDARSKLNEKFSSDKRWTPLQNVSQALDTYQNS